MDPYRDPYVALEQEERRRFDPDLAGVYLAAEILTIARVAMGVRLHQCFGAELTIATAAIFLLPWLAISVDRCGRRATTRRVE